MSERRDMTRPGAERARATARTRTWHLACWLAVASLGCGDDDVPCEPECEPPPEGCEYRRFVACECGMLVCEDGGPPDGGASDAEVELDAEVDAAVDADLADVGSVPLDACSPPLCPLAPSGCRYLPSDDPCVCPEIDCGCGSRPGPDGPEPIVCGPMEYCDRAEPVDCNGPGVCRERPAPSMPETPACPTEVAPVCSCNGNTFDNECLARLAGETPASSGPCPEPPIPDCRDGGMCTDTEACIGCPGEGGVMIFACRPPDLECPEP